MTVKQFSKFEKQNNFPINVFEFYTSGFAPVYLSKIDEDHATNIGLYDDHYVWIKNFDRLIGQENHHQGKFCVRCLQKYFSDDHKKYCSKSGEACIEMPVREKDKKIYFKNIKNMQKQQFVIYGDFEAVIEDQIHKPCGYCLFVKSTVPQFQFPMKLYRGSNE